MSKPVAIQIPTIENLSKTYIDPVTAQIIIEQLAVLKRKTALAEEQLLILRQENLNNKTNKTIQQTLAGDVAVMQ